ncbi:MAG: uracil-DNA glycosylase [Puniceicoccales bacterium]|jgi:DNA polymerase|nr:uracil-DNA glycosylase [Puniceicoccales bacterium]
MSSILNLLALELENMIKNGQSNIVLSDQSVEFLKKMNFPFLSEIGSNLPPKSENVSQSAYPENTVKLIQEGDKMFKYNWLHDKVLNCPICQQHVRPGKKIVLGVGNLDAEIFFCGEAPGADEETIGEPFVGRAGQLLTKIISAMGLSRSDVYIGNIMNWRPEMESAVGNRPPTQDEMCFCLPYLEAQIEIVQPKVIVALGATAVNGLLGHDSSRLMKNIRGKWFEFHGVPLMVTFHPSYLLRNSTNAAKRIVWEDMLAVMSKINMTISEKQQNFFL